MKGSDINFPIFFDKNSCRENKNENYIFSDTVLIGDSSLFGYSIASPYDIAGKLRELNPDKNFKPGNSWHRSKRASKSFRGCYTRH